VLLEYGAAQSDCEAVSVPPVNIRVGPELEAGPNVYSSALLVVRGNPMLTAWWPSEAISTTCLGVIDKTNPQGGLPYLHHNWWVRADQLDDLCLFCNLNAVEVGYRLRQRPLFAFRRMLRSRKLKPNLHGFQETISMAGRDQNERRLGVVPTAVAKTPGAKKPARATHNR
jgi:hypothetical protein